MIATDGAVVQVRALVLTWRRQIICLVCIFSYQSGGELQNDEHTAEVILRLLKNSQKLVNSLGSESKSKMHRLSGEA